MEFETRYRDEDREQDLLVHFGITLFPLFNPNIIQEHMLNMNLSSPFLSLLVLLALTPTVESSFPHILCLPEVPYAKLLLICYMLQLQNNEMMPKYVHRMDYSQDKEKKCLCPPPRFLQIHVCQLVKKWGNGDALCQGGYVVLFECYQAYAIIALLERKRISSKYFLKQCQNYKPQIAQVKSYRCDE
ncbi:hypothetical protein llap_3039 [Limosa lapponica baueri]|uniref:Uncharacterized protein n=1 Tax=Limosa lapponica baueri TaxID=1758121 RepID=A0A2I0UKR8_LIMLA|nr:hypothetical protein llap_3039 [Limosa lapponica baueri]